MPVNEDLLKQWLEALRGGKYAQGRNALRMDNRYCCLGVLCDIAKDTGGKWGRTEEGHTAQYTYLEEGFPEEGLLPRKLAALLGLSEPTGRFRITAELYKQFPNLPDPGFDPSGTRTCTLIALNDDYNWKFAEIANLVEARPQGLFVGDYGS